MDAMLVVVLLALSLGVAQSSHGKKEMEKSAYALSLDEEQVEQEEDPLLLQNRSAGEENDKEEDGKSEGLDHSLFMYQTQFEADGKSDDADRDHLRQTCNNNGVGSRSCGAVRGRCRRQWSCFPYEFYSRFVCPQNGCTCCRPCPTTSACRYGASYGYCVNNIRYYLFRFANVFYDPARRCYSDQCRYCLKVCVRLSSCRNAGGYCMYYRNRCRSGFVVASGGCGDGQNCRCCVPRSRLAEVQSTNSYTSG